MPPCPADKLILSLAAVTEPEVISYTNDCQPALSDFFFKKTDHKVRCQFDTTVNIETREGSSVGVLCSFILHTSSMCPKRSIQWTYGLSFEMGFTGLFK